MFRTKKVVVFAVVFLLAIASSAFALNVAELRQQMWTWSSLESVLHDATHSGGYGSSPVVSPQEADKCIAEAREKISKMVADIKTAEELAQARAVAAEFISMDDFEEEVGVSLNKLLDRQEKFLKAHQEL
ncbi:MAG TPA: hypothetical protein PLM07_16165 [Candidatus Rifleibacterium sp.]|nr:hypothetical protein [Candidatus Rifleibacterium sp.]HPT47418.1 hypothetical protein [Candidatus Rifleibacterium sp.]